LTQLALFWRYFTRKQARKDENDLKAKFGQFFGGLCDL
jgi:hypothetical protein